MSNKKIKWIFPVYSVLIGCSRLYLMVHYPTDVIGGVICGMTAGILAYFIVKAVLKMLEKSDNNIMKKINAFDLGEIIKKKKA